MFWLSCNVHVNINECSSFYSSRNVFGRAGARWADLGKQGKCFRCGLNSVRYVQYCVPFHLSLPSIYAVDSCDTSPARLAEKELDVELE